MNINNTITWFGTPSRGGLSTILSHEVGNDLTQLMNDWEFDLDDMGVIMAAILVQIATLNVTTIRIHTPNPATLRVTITPPIAATANTAAVEGIYITPENMLTYQDTDLGVFIRRVSTALPNAKAWILDLVACNQTRMLTRQNIANYFMMTANVRINATPLVPILAFLSTNMPKLAANETIRGLLGETDFVKYHTTATSTAKLLQLMVETLGPVSNILLSDGTRAAITAAANANWDKTRVDAIPKAAIAMCHAFLKANKRLPDDWYQGTKAVDQIPVSTYNAWITLFNRLATLTVNASAINDATTVMNALEAAPANVKGI